MDENSGLGGKIENAYGGTSGKENWGKKAPWCDYSGPVKDRFVGITIMDHPGQPALPRPSYTSALRPDDGQPLRVGDYKADPSSTGP